MAQTMKLTCDDGEGAYVVDVSVQELTTPAAVAWRWSRDYETMRVEHELAWLRGTETLLYAINRGEGWHSTTVVAPQRFGVDGSLTGARKAIRAFLSA